MMFNGHEIDPFDCLKYEWSDKYYMFPIYNRYRCLRNKQVSLDYRMEQCINAN